MESPNYHKSHVNNEIHKNKLFFHNWISTALLSFTVIIFKTARSFSFLYVSTCSSYSEMKRETHIKGLSGVQDVWGAQRIDAEYSRVSFCDGSFYDDSI